jgi:hypothetical protein
MSSLTSKGLGGLVPGTTLTSVGPFESSRQIGLGSLLGSGLLGVPPPPPPLPHNALARALYGRGPLSSLANVFPQPETKRKVYFAFDFDDAMRVNVVRNAWLIKYPDSAEKRSFYDRSIWESSKIQDENGLKALMREGVQYSSAICVLIGTNTCLSKWVKYEIARAVVDDRGLLGVHINGLKHVRRGTSDSLGYSALHCMGIYAKPNGRYYLCERVLEKNTTTQQFDWVWREYQDFKDPVSLPRYIRNPSIQRVMPLGDYTEEYDYVAQNGHGNIGAWIDRAAAAVGR